MCKQLRCGESKLGCPQFAEQTGLVISKVVVNTYLLFLKKTFVN